MRMRIVFLTAGAAGMYCGGCLHDNTLAAALGQGGDDALLVPLYTPIRTDEEDVSHRRIFFGGVSAALQQRWPVFRHAPRWFDRLLDSRSMLSWLGRFAGGTDPRTLGMLTCSMLEGEHGGQCKQLETLVEWLADQARPDVIHLSNTLLAGTARRLHDRLGVPLVCSLAGEDHFVEQLAPPYNARARSLLQKACQGLDALVAMNRYYADFMSTYVAVPPTRIHVIPHGLNLAGHGDGARGRAEDDPFTIGYLARICPEKGLHLLAEAFAIASRTVGVPPLRLKVAGYLSRRERPYFDRVERDIRNRGLADQCEYAGELDRDGKLAFLKSLDAFCLPTVQPESKGLPVLEALANAVPVLVPSHGAFPEIVHDTAGGLLFPPGDANALAQIILQLVRQPALAVACGANGRQAIVDRYHAPLMARRTRALYRKLTGK